MYYTINDTTTYSGQSVASVIADTNYAGSRITTYELIYPRYIHSEFLTHRVFSRNASSSRATPLSITCNEVETNPVFFDYVGRNQKGMVAGDRVSDEVRYAFRKEWEELGRYVASKVRSWDERFHIHKQTLNRTLEPWLRIRVLVTATDWDNFLRLRLKEDAQPEFRKLAEGMVEALSYSTPTNNNVHIPYWDEEIDGDSIDFEYFKDECNQVEIPSPATVAVVNAVASCARVSYLKNDCTAPTFEEDLNLVNRLYKSGHCTPFEHVAFARAGRYANFSGWQSLRNILFG